MVNRKRNIQLKIWLTEEERRLIDEKMKLLPTSQIGAYIRKMAIDGYIIYTDTANIKEMNKELRAIGRNINQIAKRVNSTGDIYRGDITELRERLGEIWQLQRTILSTLRRKGRMTSTATLPKRTVRYWYIPTAVPRKQRILNLNGRGKRRGSRARI